MNRSLFTKRFLIFFFIFSFVLFSTFAFADDKDWKILTSIGAEFDKVLNSTALVLTVEYSKVLSEGDVILFGGIDVDYYLSLPDTYEDDQKAFINPYVGVDYSLSDVTTLEARIDYSTKDKAPIILVRVIFEW